MIIINKQENKRANEYESGNRCSQRETEKKYQAKKIMATPSNTLKLQTSFWNYRIHAPPTPAKNRIKEKVQEHKALVTRVQ